MFPKVIETRKEFDEMLSLSKGKDIIALPIFSYQNKHAIHNTLCVLFISIDSTIYVLPFNHNEASSLPIWWLSDIHSPLIVPDKKEMLYILPSANLIDMSSVEMYINGTLESDELYKPIIWKNLLARHSYNKIYNIDSLIPLMKMIEYAEKYIEFIRKTYKFDAVHQSYNDIIIPTLQYIEKQGLVVDEKEMKSHFGDNIPVMNSLVYSKYDPYTLTGRPSNTFGGINFLAINKTDNSRNSFISRFDNGLLILMDFESFHLRLIADLIGFPQPTDPFHEFLSKEYLGITHLTQEQYEAGKSLTWSYLYGTRRPATPIPFFEAVYEWIDKLWEKSQKDGFLTTYLGKTIQLSNINNPDKLKLFNYYVQSRECWSALAGLFNCIPLFEKAKSKPILYTYDSILIDFCLDDGKDWLLEVKNVLEFDGKYPLRLYYGRSYGELKKLK